MNVFIYSYLRQRQNNYLKIQNENYRPTHMPNKIANDDIAAACLPASIVRATAVVGAAVVAVVGAFVFLVALKYAVLVAGSSMVVTSVVVVIPQPHSMSEVPYAFFMSVSQDTSSLTPQSFHD